MEDYFSYCQERQVCDPSIAKLFNERFRHLGVGTTSGILEIGAGSGRLARTGCLPQQCIGVDTNPPPGSNLIQASASLLPFADDCFDVVVSLSVFDVIWDLDGALAEMARVLRVGGAIIHVMDLRPTPLSLFVDNSTRARLSSRRVTPLFDRCISGSWLSGLGVLRQEVSEGLPALSVAAAFVDNCDIGAEVGRDVLDPLRSPALPAQIMGLPTTDSEQVDYELNFMAMFRARLTLAAQNCGLMIDEDGLVDNVQKQLGLAGEFGPGYVRTIPLRNNQSGIIAHRAHVAVIRKV